MSNLFKQYNTIEQQQNIRVMDYNSMVEQKLARLTRQQNNGSSDEFQNLEMIADKVEEDPAEVIQKAKDEAEQILQEAGEKADSMLSSAKTEAEEMFARAKEEGGKQGYEEGFHQAQETLEAEYQQKQEELERLEQKRQDNYEMQMQELEPKLLDVILTVVEKVFHIQFKDKREILLYLVGNAIANIEGSKSFRIRIGIDQKEFIEFHKEEILDRVGHDMSLEIVSDIALSGNQCIIETETGVFDCSMDVQLKNLIKDLRSLSA